jgi:GntR family transcriptional repressor for pyruvate dehydrogenase complex
MSKNEYKFEPIQKNSLVVELAKRLMDYIFSGSIQPGDRLPAERQLSEALGVGRSAIREAIKSLTVLGILEVRQGDGTYLKKTESGILPQTIEWSLLLGERHAMDLVEARKELEISVARFAAVRREQAELEEMERVLERMKSCTLSEFVELDIAFHAQMYDMAKNSVLKDILVNIQSLLRTWIRLVIEKAGSTDFSYQYHYRIYQAISERDPAAAVQAMEEHLGDATERLIEVIRASERMG